MIAAEYPLVELWWRRDGRWMGGGGQVCKPVFTVEWGPASGLIYP
jgi:hypothetical protein